MGQRRFTGRSRTGRRRRPPLFAIQVEVVGGSRQSVSGLGAWLARIAPPGARGQVSVALVSDARARSLNRRYRGEEGPTDVLSFPQSLNPQSLNPQSLNPQSPDPPFLGDVVIARGVARRQARQARHSLRDEIRVLALHGLLHLLGYDHERDTGAMARIERRLRARGGLGEALTERSGRHRANA